MEERVVKKRSLVMRMGLLVLLLGDRKTGGAGLENEKVVE